MDVNNEMIPASEYIEAMKGLGFERVVGVQGTSYVDNSMVVIMPTRGMIHWKVKHSHESIVWPMNQRRACFPCVGEEVGKAYNLMIQGILANPELSKWKYVLTLEDDNVQPPDVVLKLIESIESSGGLDAVSGIYFTKGDLNMPMAYGDPEAYRKTGVLDFRPRDIRSALLKGQLIEVNGIAMGCSLYRMQMFKDIQPPWFVTVNEWDPQKGTACYTQDLSFCEKAKKAGKRFAVDCRVKVGHVDVNTGVIY